MKLLLIALSVFSINAFARDYQPRMLTWECPTQRVDGSPFVCAVDAAGYDLERVTGGVSTIIEIDAADTSLNVQADPAGTLYRLRVCDTAGDCSDWSAQVARPSKPGNVKLRWK